MSGPMDLFESYADVLARTRELYHEAEDAIAAKDPSYCRGCAYTGIVLYNRAMARAWLEQPNATEDERAYWTSTLQLLLAEEIPLHGAKPGRPS